MKKINLFLMGFLALAVLSCSSDDENTVTDDADPDGLNDQEEVLLDVSAVMSDVNIEGATLIEGSPVPTGDIEFSLDFEKQTAFQVYGFDIDFEAPEDFAGAYIQLTDENGVADSYFDVPASATYDFYAKTQKTEERSLFRNRGTENGTITSKATDTTIDVNFGESVSAGTFCYLICVYDAQGNISEPSEVCVTVEAWGGNVNLVADWMLTKKVIDGEAVNLGEEDCAREGDTESLQCDSGETLEFVDNYCFTRDGFNMVFNSDGTYSYLSEYSDDEFDYEASAESCEAVFKVVVGSYSSTGNWAYNEEEEQLTLVEFEYTELYDGELYPGLEEEGYLLFDGHTSVTDAELVITETYTYDAVEEVSEYHFAKQ